MVIWPEAHDSKPPITLRETVDGLMGSAHEITGFVRWLFRFGHFSKHG